MTSPILPTGLMPTQLPLAYDITQHSHGQNVAG